MALGDEQIDRFDQRLQERLSQLNQILDAKIDRVEQILNSVVVTNTTSFNTNDKNAPPIAQAVK